MAENSLRALRRAAGYTSARAFAEEIGIPTPTYARYEQIDDGPDTPMPIRNAWTIADALGCSIDALVGREPIEPGAVQGDVQAAYNRLSAAGKRDLDRYLAYLAHLDEREGRRAEERRMIERAQVCRELELAFAAGEERNPFDCRTPETRREQFEAYVAARAREQAQGEVLPENVREVIAGIMDAYDDAHPESKPQGKAPYEHAAPEAG